MNKTGNNLTQKMTNYRWTICIMMFLALTVNYLDRQVLSLTWDEFIKPEFHWNEILHCLCHRYVVCRPRG